MPFVSVVREEAHSRFSSVNLLLGLFVIYKFFHRINSVGSVLCDKSSWHNERSSPGNLRLQVEVMLPIKKNMSVYCSDYVEIIHALLETILMT